MSKKKPNVIATKSKRLAHIDPARLVEWLDSEYTDIDQSPYRRLYVRSRDAFLGREGGDTEQPMKLLDHIDAAAGLETAIKNAAFVLGFETCRQLLLGELDLAAIKKRAAADREWGEEIRRTVEQGEAKRASESEASR